MGHQFAGAVAAAALALVAASACGGGDDDAGPPAVLDNARDLVSVESTTAIQAGGAGASTVPQVDELPAPDASTYEGANRVVNLWTDADGQTQSIDVWGRRTFANGPILLVEQLEFGEASDYFSAPSGYSLAVVGAGAGPDGEELAGMFNAGPADQVTMVFTNDDPDGVVWAPNLWEQAAAETGLAPQPPQPGMGLVYLYAPNTRSFDETLTTAVGGSSFYVGDGSSRCARQRIEDEGFAPNVLGGTQDVQLELPQGPAVVSLHPWFSPDECDQPATIELTLDVPADSTVMVLVYSPDGETIETLQLPVHS